MIELKFCHLFIIYHKSWISRLFTVPYFSVGFLRPVWFNQTAAIVVYNGKCNLERVSRLPRREFFPAPPPPPLPDTIGTLSSNDDNTSKNVKNLSVLISKTLALRVRYKVWYIYLSSSAKQRHEMTTFKVYGKRERRMISFPFSFWTLKLPPRH